MGNVFASMCCVKYDTKGHQMEMMESHTFFNTILVSFPPQTTTGSAVVLLCGRGASFREMVHVTSALLRHAASIESTTCTPVGW